MCTFKLSVIRYKQKMVSLSVENLMKTDNPILHRILQLLDFSSLEAYSLAIDTYLWNSLNISFDLNRKLKPWAHNTTTSIKVILEI